MEQSAKLILNSLKCPLCKSQVDLFDWVHPRIGGLLGNNFGCVSDPHHYGIYFVHWEDPIRIEKENITLYEGKYQYKVTQNYFIIGIPASFTEIDIREVDAENRVIDNKPIKHFGYNKILFDFSKTNREKILNRVKTILVFQ